MERVGINIEKQLEQEAQTGKLAGRSRLLGRDFKSLGIPLREVRSLVSRVYRENKEKGTEDYIEVSKSLLLNDVYEKKLAGIFLLGKYIRDRNLADFTLFEEFIGSHIDEWSLCDTFATEVVAPSLVMDWKNGKETLAEWSVSKNKWVRRCTLVSIIKCQDKVAGWQNFSAQLLEKFKSEKEEIVKKASKWLIRRIEE